jgi:hypothetical protein
MIDRFSGRNLGVVAVLAVLATVAIIPFVVPSLTQPQTQYLAGVMVLSAGVLAFWGTHLTRITTEENNLREHHRERESNFHDRFTAAATQLSDVKSGIRQAGAYALAALANDWDRHGKETGDPALGRAERQVCIDILCAYLRDPSRTAEPGEAEVRKTVVGLIRAFTLLGERKRPSWTGHEFMLSGARLRGANLAHANLSGADLSNTDLSMASLIRADLSGANLVGASLTGANLIGTNLARTDLSAADFSETQLTEADLFEATWTSEPVWPAEFTPPHNGDRTT